MSLYFTKLTFFTGFSRHATLSSSYLTTFEDNQCILRIELLCTTQGLESLRWWFDNNQVVAFTYFNAMFPHTVYNQRGIVIKIINAVVDPSNANRFAGTSMLTTNATVLQRLHRDTIQCGTNAVRSQSINVQQLKHDGNTRETSGSNGCCIHKKDFRLAEGIRD